MILSYASATGRAGLAALLALDDMLAGALRTVREPMAAQMRMTWWHDALSRLSDAPLLAEPVLQALARDVIPRGVTGTELTRIVEGWEELLEPDDLDEAALMRFAAGRGAVFVLAGQVLGVEGPLLEAGQGWALADLARHSRDAGHAAALASPLLEVAGKHRWSRKGRALGAMVHLARIGDAGPGARTARALWHRTTGW
jgi:phytoene synthase